MNCKWAEEHLSAYLDDALDPPLAGEVGEHVAQCEHCSAILDDHRRFDLLLRDYPRVEPAPELKDRIFSSPQMIELLRQEAAAGGELVELDDEGRLRHPVVSPSQRLVSASRILLPVAALLTLVLGAALLFKQGLLPSGHPSSPTITTIGNPGGQAPLAAGTRLVYERDGALWSGRDDGQGVAQQLTPSGVRVAGWSVAPVSGQASASLVAYIDAGTGAIHVIRGDGLNDTVIGYMTTSTTLPAGFWQTAAGQAVQVGLAWAPDGTRVAYLAATNADSTVLHIVNVRGSGDTAVGASASSLVANPLWSADSLYVAFTATHDSAQSVWAYNVATSQTRELASQSGASATARATHASWVAGAATPTLTWAAVDAGHIEGFYAAHADAATSATRLTLAGASYDAADSRNGLWLVASGNTLSTVSATSGVVHQVSTASAPITSVVWSPTGSAAAVTGADFVATWSADHGLSTVAQGDVQVNLVAWSPDGKSLAYVVGDTVKSTGASVSLAQHVTDVVALRWSPDGQHLAIATPTAVLIVKRDGTVQATVDTHAATDGTLLWTVMQ